MTSRGKQIAQAAGLIMAAYVASRGLGLVREMVIATQFGTSVELGAYLAAFRIPDLIFQLVAGGALGSSFIPVFSVYLARRETKDAWRLASAIYNLVGLITAASALLAFVLTPQLTTLLVPGFTPEMQALTGRLMRMMLLTPIIFGLSGISMAILNAYQHFLLPAFAPVLYNLAIIGGALFLTRFWGIDGLAVGVVIGAILHFLVQLPGLRRRGWSYSPILSLRLAGVREVISLLLPRVLGLAVMQINFLVNMVLASGLSEDSLSALNYAFMLMMLPQGVFAMAIATAAFPSFSDLVARQQLDKLRETLAETLRAALFLTIPASVGLLILRFPLIQVLLERGEFTSASTKSVAWALQFYALGLPAYAAVEIVSRAFYALHDTRTPVGVGAATVALNIILSLLLIRPLGHGGLALANALAVNIEMVSLFWFLRRRLGGLAEEHLIASMRQIIPAALLMGLGLAIVLWLGQGRSSWLLTGVGIIVGGGIYAAASWALGATEMHTIGDWVWQRITARNKRTAG